ncbi:DUF1934 domain-containing protein [Virgibacillus proomii]|uniref:DUF1934 domain-containing protein n=1 Tax=Virgibacillus proomii TaxID=84407 RepID=UPI001C11756D|nr:DUF1934 domain-containing protein [Virgibacillus proomii]MBU5267956.1 DUF1934 domain-containing protein [Virgibacillus proomii]
MVKQQIPVIIKLYTTIEENGEKEYHNIEQRGTFYRRGHIDVLMYEEAGEEMSTVSNLLTIQPNKVNLKRSGNVKMNQQFLLNKKTENIVKHPYGSLHMETFTTKIVYEPIQPAKVGSLHIAYKIKLNDQHTRRQQIDLIIKKEDKA